MQLMRPTLLAITFVLVLVVAAETAGAQPVPGTIGNAGRMPETMSPGAQPPTSMPPPTPARPIQAYPNTQSLSRDRIESQGYRVQRMHQQNDGSWKADASRDPVPTRPKGVPSKITIFPDGRVLEERVP
jgi:hypothetical protein